MALEKLTLHHNYAQPHCEGQAAHRQRPRGPDWPGPAHGRQEASGSQLLPPTRALTEATFWPSSMTGRCPPARRRRSKKSARGLTRCWRRSGRASAANRRARAEARQQPPPAGGFRPRLSNAPPWDRAAKGLGLSRLPFASQPLAFGLLCWRDLALNPRNGLLGLFIALRLGQQIPFVSFRLVLRHA